MPESHSSVSGSRVKLPYCDQIIARHSSNDEVMEELFGTHIHWGCWDLTKRVVLSRTDYMRAVDELAKMHSELGNIESGQSVLDVGCGFGGTLSLANEQFEKLHYGKSTSTRAK